MVVLLPGAAYTASWPMVRPFSKSYEVDLDADLVAIDVPFTTKDGSAHYLFWCRGGSEKTLDSLSARDGIHYTSAL